MGKIDRVLRKAFPGREVFSEDEVRLAKAALYVANSDAPKSRMPRTDVPIGEYVNKGGRRYRCIVRERVITPADACIGCALRDRPCSGLRCSSFDRSDGLNVWFEEA